MKMKKKTTKSTPSKGPGGTPKPDRKKKGQPVPISAEETHLEYAIAQAYEGLRQLGHSPMMTSMMVSALLNTNSFSEQYLVEMLTWVAVKFGDVK
jgi:hypothetical protein